MRILVTGASGFIGSALVSHLLDTGRFIVRGAVRRGGGDLPLGLEHIAVGNLAADEVWQSSALAGVNTIVHLAARVHVMNDPAIDPLSEFRRINVAGTLNLARQASATGVRRFVYLSSIKVNGEETALGRPFTEQDDPSPVDPYSVSKYEAEQGLLKLAMETGLEVVIIRPPLVYGPGVKANFLSMMRCLHRGVPLPFGALSNRRSLVALDNLIDFIVICVDHPAAINQIFLVGDSKDLSISGLLQHMAAALGKPARLLPIPQNILKIGLKLVGKGGAAQRLCGSLQVNTSKARTLLGWVPPVSVDEALAKTARYFLDLQSQ